MARVSHKSLFNKLSDPLVIQKSEQYANWTLPQLMADVLAGGLGKRANVERDYQEFGALLVNALAPKLARMLFPTNFPFFKIEMSDALVQFAKEQAHATDAELQSALAQHEIKASQRLFMNSSYAQLILALKHLIVTGNTLLFRNPTTKRLVAYGLRSFGIRRDGQGAMIDCVLREATYVEALPFEVQQALRLANRAKYSRPEQVVEVFTRIHRVIGGSGTFYEVTEEVDEYPVGERSVYPEHLCPWIPATWSLIIGEHYARGMVEDYAAGFAKLSDTAEAATLYGIEMARVVHLVANGPTDIDDLAKAETGEYIRGDKDAVTTLEAGDAQRLTALVGVIQDTFQGLARAFMYQANTRDAERVTMFELRQNALEAESALGGAYSTLSEGIQAPLANLLLVEEAAELMAGILSADVKVDISTGIPALGRNAEVQNLLMASEEAAGIVPVVSKLDTRVSVHRVMDIIYAGRSVDTVSIFKTKQELEEEQAADKQIAAGQNALVSAQTAPLQSVEALQSIQG